MSKRYDKKYDWVKFSQSYLCLARLGCQELLGEKYNITGFISKHDLKYGIPDLFVPILFDIKHGIEIFIKTLKIILADQLYKNEKMHNISELFVVLKEQMMKHKIVELIKKEYSENPNDINLQLVSKDVDRLATFLENLEKLIYRYYHCAVIKEKISDDFIIEDIDNSAFRYPENNLKSRRCR